MPTLFTFPEYSHLSGDPWDVPGIRPGLFSIGRYANQELHAAIQSGVSGEPCFILGSLGPPESHMASLLLLAHTLRKEGASRITGVLPYLAYAREDKLKAGESLAAAWVGALLKASAFDEIWTVDVHSEQDQRLFPLPIESLSPSEIFGECLQSHGLADSSFVAPDEGALRRCEAVRSAAGGTTGNLVHFRKHRTASDIVHESPIGQVQRKAVLVDDVLDTGATLVSACEKLVTAGAEEIYICVTHALFTGQRWRDLWSLPVRHIFCTDTVPACTSICDPRITCLAVGPLLRNQLAAILVNREPAPVEGPEIAG